MHLRAREYSPGTGRFTSRDRLSPNAPGTQGYNPYWYANDNPATLTDPSGHAATCQICTPMAFAPALQLQQQQQSLASRAKTELGTWAGQRRFTIAAFGLVAIVFACAMLPACRELGSPVDGSQIETVEEIKQLVSTETDSLEELFENIAEYLRDKRKPEPGPTEIRDPFPFPVPTPEPKPEDCKFRPFIERYFRKNLACLTHNNYPDGPPEAQAHHVFPNAKEFESAFGSIVGLNTHDPRYGQWWETSDHRDKRYVYNDPWRAYFYDKTTPPTLAEVEEEGRVIMSLFGMTTLY